MKTADLTLHQLRVVTRVGALASFTRAAEELRLSQPALSRTVREVEDRVRVRLFERTTRSVTLSAAGREFIAVAESILAGYDDGLGRFARYRAGLAGRLTVAALPSLAATLLPPVLAAFAAERPDVRITVLDGDTTQVVTAVRTGAADLALTATTDPGHGLQATALRDDEALAVLPPGHRLAARAQLTWKDLATEPFVAFAGGSSLRRLTDAAFARAAVVPERLIETEAVGTAAGLVAAGLGVCAVTETVLPLMSFVDLVPRPLTRPATGRRLTVLTAQRPLLAPAAQALHDRLVAAHERRPDRATRA